MLSLSDFRKHILLNVKLTNHCSSLHTIFKLKTWLGQFILYKLTISIHLIWSAFWSHLFCSAKCPQISEQFGPQTLKAAHEWLKWTWKWCHPLEILGNWGCWCATALASDAWACCWWYYLSHGKDDRLSFCREWHADNVCHFMTGLSSLLLGVLTNAPWETHGLRCTC